VTRQHRIPEWRTIVSRHLHSDNAAALLLALAALATAWSSYQASVWGGVQSAQYTLSAVLRGKAATAHDEAARLRLVDAMLFTKWLEADADQRPRLVSLYEAHFRPEFRVSFDEWLGDSSRQVNSTPFDRADYHSSKATEAARLDSAANHALQLGQQANDVSDRYVFSTVLFATVLFFAGAVRPLVGPKLRTFMLLFGTFLCVTALIRVVTTPVAR
jgi:hypothetical protein